MAYRRHPLEGYGGKLEGKRSRRAHRSSLCRGECRLGQTQGRCQPTDPVSRATHRPERKDGKSCKERHLPEPEPVDHDCDLESAERDNKTGKAVHSHSVSHALVGSSGGRKSSVLTIPVPSDLLSLLELCVYKKKREMYLSLPVPEGPDGNSNNWS